MALADTITSLGNSIIALVGTRAKKDLSNIDEAGVAKIKSYAGGGGSNPVGTVIAYMGTTVPDGYLLMDGREVSKETYADLYAVVGDTMGTATDSTKFVIANMTDGRYLMGSTVAGASVTQNLPASTFSFCVVGDGKNNRYMNLNAAGSCRITQVGSGRDAYTSQNNAYGTQNYLTYNPAIANKTYSTSNTKVNPLSCKCILLIKY